MKAAKKNIKINPMDGGIQCTKRAGCYGYGGLNVPFQIFDNPWRMDKCQSYQPTNTAAGLRNPFISFNGYIWNPDRD